MKRLADRRGILLGAATAAVAFGALANSPHSSEIAITIGFEGGGDFFLADDSALTFRGEAASAPYAYMGVHITRPDYADQGPDGPFSLSPLWRASAAEGRLFGCVLDGDWMHVGDPQARDHQTRRAQQFGDPRQGHDQGRLRNPRRRDPHERAGDHQMQHAGAQEDGREDEARRGSDLRPGSHVAVLEIRR